MSSSGSAAARFAAFGYTVLRNVLTEAECRSISSEFTSAFHRAYPDLLSRRTPAWLPGLADATPCSASLAVDDGRLWSLSEELLGCETLPCPPEVAWLRGITPWHYDDPLGLRAVKFIAYVSGPSTGLCMLPMSHAPQQSAAIRDFLAESVGFGLAARTPTEAAEKDLVPSVPVAVQPGDAVAIDLHVWHCYRVREARILWSPEYVAWPSERPDAIGIQEKFAAVATAGVLDSGEPDWPVWREWLRASPPTDRRKRAIDMLRDAGAFRDDRDLR